MKYTGTHHLQKALKIDKFEYVSLKLNISFLEET